MLHTWSGIKIGDKLRLLDVGLAHHGYVYYPYQVEHVVYDTNENAVFLLNKEEIL